ncbi:probable disease resistance protein At5g45490 [Juglans microcarpa x Juglans regia]|uniref:probable disease resistance protein At5g45490 n=1 Tax=Juglans microcarpa x Juglans regia TaxID=2249226 RepID=UPI001B7EB2D7|nr:probable disease resistance protein At5g45490 [Juglans microcarpa x Juglans regia]
MGSEKNQETPEVSNTKESSEKTKGPPDQVDSDHSQDDGQEEISTSSGLKVHGFENEMISLEKILKRRQSEDEFKAIGIVGELGVGKSTLCRALLNKNEVKTSFLPRIWVRMSKKSEAENSEEAVVKRMLECLGVDEEIIKSICMDNGRALDDKERLNALLYALHLQLNGKKYLIVLDDVWKEDEWYRDLSAAINRSYDWNERLAYGLPKGNGGTVIVTSRNKEVAKKMVGKEENIHNLLPLWNQESCWSIFTDTVEREKQVLNLMGQEDLEKAKKDLFEKCGGLPLAAKMMGKAMAEKLKEEAAAKAQVSVSVPVAERIETHDDGASGEGTGHVGDLQRSHIH